MKNLPTYLPMLSVALIFTGYCHLHFYYCTQFNIDIYQFISTSEIVLSFLPIAYYLFILILLSGIMAIIYITSPDAEKKEKEKRVYLIYPFIKYDIPTNKEYSFSVYYRFFESKKKTLTTRQKWFLRYKLWFHFQTIFGTLWAIVTIHGLTHEWFQDAFIRFVFGLVWITIVFLAIKRRFNIAVAHIFKNNHKQVYIGYAAFTVFIFADYVINKFKAEEVKNRTDQQSISFNYDNKKYDTFNDSLLSYIGSTQQYIFIYSLKSNNNLIFEKNEVSNLIIGDRQPKDSVVVAAALMKKNLTSICDSLKKFDTMKTTSDTAMLLKKNKVKPDSLHDH